MPPRESWPQPRGNASDASAAGIGRGIGGVLVRRLHRFAGLPDIAQHGRDFVTFSLFGYLFQQNPVAGRFHLIDQLFRFDFHDRLLFPERIAFLFQPFYNGSVFHG
jgi:hypothetical protein